jgi:hypothetical protein
METLMKKYLLIIFLQFFSLNVFAITLTQLPGTDLLRAVSEKLNNGWIDKNKSNCGKTLVKSFQARGSSSDLIEISKKLLLESYGNEIDPKTEISVNTKNIEDADMALVINALMESYNSDSSSFDQRIAFTKNLQQLLNNLEVNKNTLVVTAEAKTDGCHPGQKIMSVFFYKAESERAFQVFTAQGF